MDLGKIGRAASAAWKELTMIDDYGKLSLYHGLSESEKSRSELYSVKRAYYDGNHRAHLKKRSTPSGPGPDDNVIINLSRRVVDAGASFLFGYPVRFELDNGTEEADQLLDDWMEGEEGMSFLSELALDGGIAGDFYLQIILPEAGDPDGQPKLVSLDPALTFPRVNPRNKDEVLLWDLRWYDAEGVVNRLLHFKDETGRWWTQEEKLDKGKSWVLTVEPWPWEYAGPMIIHGKNLPNPHRTYGLSDLEDATLNDTINRVASNLNRLTRLYAHPLPWARGFSQATAIDGSQMAMTSEPNATMGVLELSNTLGGSFEFLQFLRTSWAEVTRVPQNDPDRMQIGAQSGFALTVLFNDLIQKTNFKRNLYGSCLIKALETMMEIAGYPEQKVRLYWQSPLPTDQTQEIAKDTFELDRGLSSKERIATKRGIDWDTEQDRITEEGAQSGNLGDQLLANFQRGNLGI